MIEFNVKEYGASGDGARDDGPDIAHAVDVAGVDRGVFFPSGSYRIASDLTVRCATTFAPGAKLLIDAGATVTLRGAMIAPQTRIFDGRGAVEFGEGRLAEVYPQWWGAVDDQGHSSDSTRAIQAALDSLGIWGGRVAIPHGRYIVTSSITLPADRTDGRTLEIVGYGEALIHNRAPHDNPTFRLVATNARKASGLKLRNLGFTGDAAFPNKGLHLRFVIESLVEDCLFNCHGNAIYVDGGVFGLVVRNVQIWPTGRRHRATTTHTGSSGILFDTPLGGSFAHTITIDDLVVEAGGRGVELKPGYSAYGWRIGRVLAEGLTGGDGWGVDLAGLAFSEIGPIYTEFNSPDATGDGNDRQIRLGDCTGIQLRGGIGTGLVQLRDCTDIDIFGLACQKFDADKTNTHVWIRSLRHSVVGGPAAGFVNNSRETFEFGIRGGGSAQPSRANYSMERPR